MRFDATTPHSLIGQLGLAFLGVGLLGLGGGFGVSPWARRASVPVAIHDLWSTSDSTFHSASIRGWVAADHPGTITNRVGHCAAQHSCVVEVPIPVTDRFTQHVAESFQLLLHTGECGCARVDMQDHVDITGSTGQPQSGMGGAQLHHQSPDQRPLGVRNGSYDLDDLRPWRWPPT